MLVYQRPWTRQPQVTPLWRQNPLFNGLLRAFRFDARGGQRELTTADPGTHTGLAFKADAAGSGREMGAANYSVWNDDYRASITTELTVFFVGSFTTAVNGIIFGNAEPEGLGYNWMLYGNVGKASLFTKVAGVGLSAAGTSNIDTGAPVVLVGTFDGTNMRLYVNGVLESISSSTGTLDANDFETSLNRWNANSAQVGNAVLAGALNKVWTPAQVVAFYVNSWQLFAPLPRRLWMPQTVPPAPLYGTLGQFDPELRLSAWF